MTAESRPRPFCDRDKAAEAAFDRWAARLEAAGVELAEPDLYVVGLLASREARLEGLVAELRQEKDAGRRIRLVSAERLAAQDMAKALDHAERVFGASVAEPGELEREQPATGTDGGARVLPFDASPARGLSVVAQRIVAVLAKTSRPLTREALRRRVAGSEDDFGRGLKEAIKAEAVNREGLGKKGKPYTYTRGDA